MKTKIKFFPSLYHSYLLALTRTDLAYEGGPVAAWQARPRMRLTEMVGFGGEERGPLAQRML